VCCVLWATRVMKMGGVCVCVALTNRAYVTKCVLLELMGIVLVRSVLTRWLAIASCEAGGNTCTPSGCYCMGKDGHQTAACFHDSHCLSDPDSGAGYCSSNPCVPGTYFDENKCKPCHSGLPRPVTLHPKKVRPSARPARSANRQKAKNCGPAYLTWTRCVSDQRFKISYNVHLLYYPLFVWLPPHGPW